MARPADIITFNDMLVACGGEIPRRSDGHEPGVDFGFDKVGDVYYPWSAWMDGAGTRRKVTLL